MTIPSPCGLSVTSVTSDNMYLYALQPDRKTVYKLDVCGRIICVFKVSRRYDSIYSCGNGRFYATAYGERNRIYILSRCFNETGYIEPETQNTNSCICNSCGNSSCANAVNTLFIGPSGSCTDTSSCMLTVADLYNSYIVSSAGRTIAHIGSAGRNLYYTAIGENNGILYEGLESRVSSQTFVRATVLDSGQTKVQRLPFGYRVRSFFCYGGRLYAYITKNSFHGYVAAICTFLCNGTLCGDIIGLPDSPYDTNCCEESCNFGACSSCGCGTTSCSCGVSSNQTEMCSNNVAGESTDTSETCSIDELCRIYNCIRALCKDRGECGVCGTGTGGCGNSCTGGCSGCVSGSTAGASGCCDGNLSCKCYPTCNCSENGGVGSENCLPLPPCEFNNPCCEPCEEQLSCKENLRVTVNPSVAEKKK